MATPNEYKSITGKELEEVKVVDWRKDTVEDLSLRSKSDSWMRQLGTIYRKLTTFVDENPEYKYVYVF